MRLYWYPKTPFASKNVAQILEVGLEPAKIVEGGGVLQRHGAVSVDRSN